MLQGSDLRQAVLAGQVERQTVAPLLLKLALALDAAHRAQQARPRLKPQNIRIDEQGDPLQLEGSLLPPAPEPQAAAEDERRDVFALGITGLFALHGQELPRRVLEDLDAFVTGLQCEPGLAAVLRRACAWDPEARYPNLRSFADALRVLPDASREAAQSSSATLDRVEGCQLLIRQDPTRLDAYQALYALYREQGDADRSWCVAAALVFLGQADEAQQAHHEAHRVRGPIRPRQPLDETHWLTNLFHPAEDVLIGKLFDAVTPALVRSRSRPDKSFGLPADRLIAEPESSTVMLARSFGFAGKVLKLPVVPRLFLLPDREGGVGTAATWPPAVLCGRGVLSGLGPLEVTYLVARHLSFYRGEHYARLIAKPEELQPILDAACSLASGTATQGQDSERLLAEIRAHAKEAELGLLPRLGPHLARAKHPLDLAGWLRAVEITAARAGFLLCGDLAAAARIGAAEPSIQRVGLSAERLVRELLLFSVSEEYFRLRAHLGIDVKAS